MARFRGRNWLLVLLICAALALAGWTAVRIVGWPLLNSRPPFAVVPDWPPLPDNLFLGQVTGVDVDAQGRLFVFARGSKLWDTEPIDPAVINSPTVFIFDGQTGALTASWGENRFVMPHGLTLDTAGNVWLTDVGLNQVFKFSQTGELLLTLGEAGVAGSDQSHFNRPTDVAVASDGSFFVSDGYLNSRIVRFEAGGRYRFERGAPGSESGQFDLPHSIALDDQGRLYVADRSNGRIQIFDENGRFLTAWQDTLRLGRPWAVRVGPDGLVYVVDGGDQNDWLPDRARVIVLTAEGEIIGRFGSYGSRPGQFIWPHALALAPDGALYVAEVGTGKRVQKFLPQQ